MSADLAHDFAQIVRDEMEAQGLTRSAVCALTGISSGGLRTLLGCSHSPSLATVQRVAAGLGIVVALVAVLEDA